MASTQFPLASASLYVGDLHPDVTEADLNDRFSQAGDIASIRLCRDSLTRRSLGYAYVNYHDSQSAERALNSLNFADIRGRQVRVCWSQRDPTARRSGAGNTYIKNLPESCDNQKLYNTFSQFGNIVSSRVCADRETGKPLGYGFVQFETEEDAKKAIEAEVKIEGATITVAAYKPQKDRAAANTAFTNVYVKNLPAEWNQATMEKFFSKFGTVTSSMIQTSNDPKSQGLSFGFVNFATHDEAQNAIEKAPLEDVDGKKVYVVRALKKADRERQKRDAMESRRQERQQKWAACNLYVKMLPEDVTEDKVKEVFGKYGTITSSRVNVIDGRATGVAYVCYSTTDEATKAINELNQSPIFGKPIYVALHQPKQLRNQQRAEMWGQSRMGGFYGAPQHMGRMMMVPAGPHGVKQQYYGMHPAMGGFPMNGYMGGMRPQRGMGRGPQQGGQGPRGPRPAGPQGQQAARRRRPQQGAEGGFNEAYYNSLPADAQKNYIGEYLYPKIMALDQERGAKITGMLIEMDVQDIMKVVHSEMDLRSKVQEAIAVLQEANEA